MKILITILCLFYLSILTATVIMVPVDEPTIQEGINATAEGDTVLVQPGTYIENINFNGNNITVASLFLTTQDSSYISQTIIDGNNDGCVVIFENGEDSTAVLCGFTITNGFENGFYGGGITCRYNVCPSLLNLIIIGNDSEDRGGGILCMDSSLHLQDVIIASNGDNSWQGGGLYCLTSDIVLENVIISDNFATGGGGIYCNDNSNLILSNVTIVDNYAGQGGGIGCGSSNLTILNSTLRNNSASFGGAISCSSSILDLENVEISNNQAIDSGGGIHSSYNCNLSLENVNLMHNSAGLYGGSINLWQSALDMVDCQLENNTCGHPSYDGRGGAMYVRDSSTYIFRCGFNNNSADFHAGAIYFRQSLAEIYGCSFVGNISEGNVGGLYFFNSNGVNIENCTFYNNLGTDSGAIRFYRENMLSSTHNMKNTICWNNLPVEILCSADGLGNSFEVSYCDIEGGLDAIVTNNNAIITWSDSNINEDPLFIDSINGDVHLIEDSPCIDTGDPISPLDPDGSIADMGAYFYDQSVDAFDYDIPISEISIQLSNFPNPFNPETTISFNLPEDTKVRLEIFNIKGQRVKDFTVTLSGVEELGNNKSTTPRPSTSLRMTQAGSRQYSVVWDGTNQNNQPVSSGIYLYQLKVNGEAIASKKCLLLK